MRHADIVRCDLPVTPDLLGICTCPLHSMFMNNLKSARQHENPYAVVSFLLTHKGDCPMITKQSYCLSCDQIIIKAGNGK